MVEPRLGQPDLGVGVGLRVPHYRYVCEQKPAVDFFEIISENFMVDGGKPLYHLERVRGAYPLVQHGVALGIGNPGRLDKQYLARLKALHERVRGPWVSDHFCWTGVPGVDLHDLLPLPTTREAVELVVERARSVQDFLGVRFALENASSYMSFAQGEMPEWEFVAEVSERADIGLLLDVNNVYVAAYNHGFDPFAYINALPLERVLQIHVAGHTNVGTHIIDTHTGDVIEPVWELYRYVVERCGGAATLIEWDTDVPDFAQLLDVVTRARRERAAALDARAARVAAGRDAAVARRSGAVPEHPAHTSGPHPHRAWEQGGPRDSVAGELAEAALGP